ncbi:amino acid deaminase [Nocardia thailandica]
MTISNADGRRSAVDIDRDAVAALADTVLGPHHKAVPPSAWGRTVGEYLDTATELAHWQTPVLTLDAGALAANTALMADWAAAAGLLLAPHGKTTMAPRLWRDQLDAGAWGITLATPWQVQVGRAFGVRRILLANALLDPVGLAWIAGELARDPAFEFWCWADSVATVAAMDRVLAGCPDGPPVRVLVELGGARGRTGARTPAEAHAVAAAIGRSPRLCLAGVGGYEGALAHDRAPESLAVVRGFLDRVARLHGELADAYPGPALVSAGGSAYPDLVAEVLGGLAGPGTAVVLRSGAYLAHDDGFYAAISPLVAPAREPGLRPALHAWARVLSRPEPGLALLDAGRRDLPFDLGLPVPQRVDGRAGVLPAEAAVTALNDQHAFLRLPGAAAADLPVGSVVRLGISHPCTAFDKWRLLPVIDSADAVGPRVVDLVQTFF